jgi:aryl-alcohol dehydrogenase-like predicted oxidoreductase
MSGWAHKLGLGTVQWGLDYGISNRDGKTTSDEVGLILAAATQSGIRVLDTAALYGDAEAVIGQHPLDSFHVVTKTPRYARSEITPADADELLSTFKRSLVRLGTPAVYGLLAHHANDLLVPGGEYLIDAMLELKQAGEVGRVGVSVYDGGQIASILDRFTPDIVQLPVNVFDQRLIEDGSLDRLSALGVEIHARSVFLQGVLLMDQADIPDVLAPLFPNVEAWHTACRDQGLTPLQAALAFVCGLDAIHCCLVGVQNQSQLAACLWAAENAHPFDARGLASNDPAFVNPANWKPA